MRSVRRSASPPSAASTWASAPAKNCASYATAKPRNASAVLAACDGIKAADKEEFCSTTVGKKSGKQCDCAIKAVTKNYGGKANDFIRYSLGDLNRDGLGDRGVAQRGQHGMGSDMFGAAGDDITLKMPVGTIITDAETGEVVSRDDMVRGYEVAKGQYMIVEDEEIEAVQIESTRTIDIDQFVPKNEIDERYIDSPYYIAPDGQVGQEAFAVIRDTVMPMLRQMSIAHLTASGLVCSVGVKMTRLSTYKLASAASMPAISFPAIGCEGTKSGGKLPNTFFAD